METDDWQKTPATIWLFKHPSWVLTALPFKIMKTKTNRDPERCLDLRLYSAGRNIHPALWWGGWISEGQDPVSGITDDLAKGRKRWRNSQQRCFGYIMV